METLSDISWLGHASFFFTDIKTGNKIYYVDPFDLHATNLEKADLVFITHAHPDHDSPDDIRKIIKDDTVLIATPDVVSRLSEFKNQKQEVAPNKSYTVKNFNFATIP
ncbi:MAG TPA: MBL fold metallo-hydrolase, partial [Candidatus Saccharimonadales bacterium]|nr:MBL fold metallo-hydrolase [Candidatus Saccharimonadales bacterium]